MAINKSQFIELLAARLSVTNTEAERMVNAFTGVIYEALRGGEKVNLTGFGQFSVSYRAARIGVNPRNPDIKITIPEMNMPKFKAGEGFKEAVKIRKNFNPNIDE